MHSDVPVFTEVSDKDQWDCKKYTFTFNWSAPESEKIRKAREYWESCQRTTGLARKAYDDAVKQEYSGTPK